MLTISEVAGLYNISNQQVHDLVDYGYLTVAQVQRNKNRGIKYLFAEAEVYQLDIYSYLAEIRDRSQKNHLPTGNRSHDFKKVLGAIDHYENFLEDINPCPEYKFLRACFFLFHLNHYAKSSKTNSEELYSLKNQVLKKMYTEGPSIIRATYLVGPDRKKVWLCEDCKEAAQAAGLSYTSYIQEGFFCPKCNLQSVEKEYFSLIEFRVIFGKYRFNFHLPLSRAAKWLQGLEDLSQRPRKTGRYEDHMFLYGRRITRIEEKVFPLPVVKSELKDYLK